MFDLYIFKCLTDLLKEILWHYITVAFKALDKPCEEMNVSE